MKEEQELFIDDYGVAVEPVESVKVNTPVSHAWLKALSTVWMYVV